MHRGECHASRAHNARPLEIDINATYMWRHLPALIKQVSWSSFLHLSLQTTVNNHRLTWQQGQLQQPKKVPYGPSSQNSLVEECIFTGDYN